MPHGFFSEEPWFRKNLKWLSFGKIRSSYGSTGSDIIPDYLFLTRWSGAFQAPYNGRPAYEPLQHANPELQWQSNVKLETALNLGLFNDRITTEISWYRNQSGNQLISYLLPGLTGFLDVTSNFPATVQNSGLEFVVGAKFIKSKNFDWSFGVNAGTNWNKLLSFPGLLETPYAYTMFEGEPLNITRLLHATGVDPSNGQYTFSDKNKDGNINYQMGPNDDLYNMDMSVKWDGGFNTDVRYKNWQINLFFSFRKRKQRSAIYNGFAGMLQNNQATIMLDRWQKPGDIARFARYTTRPSDSDIIFQGSDGIYSDGSYLRLEIFL